MHARWAETNLRVRPAAATRPPHSVCSLSLKFQKITIFHFNSIVFRRTLKNTVHFHFTTRLGSQGRVCGARKPQRPSLQAAHKSRQFCVSTRGKSQYFKSKSMTYRAGSSTIGVNTFQLIIDLVISLKIIFASRHDVDMNVLHSLTSILSILNNICERSNASMLFDSSADPEARKRGIRSSYNF